MGKKAGTPRALAVSHDGPHVPGENRDAIQPGWVSMDTYKLPDGTEKKMVEVKWEALEEPWSEYKLEDGTFVRMKNVVLKVFRILDEEGNPGVTLDGEPAVLVRSTRVITAKDR